jgi:hypothetical protein
MTTSERIQQQVERLPEALQQKVLRFAESLQGDQVDVEWRNISLSTAMRGMDEEDAIYSESDLKEKF